ncbi:MULTISPECIES: uracil-DNA glycosylase [unclassified Vibrio]|uniref:Uracil-DNA glycosylase n=1 Tax=Vibrio sp. HB236076 TaxID=3232307 RepID=A0AB39HHQ5_9VIBR|nr:uracil-DNA glycosylase [Vibrio sp. HB161653]MDP5254579.1 uracil-DNA glycosylase [Vibrio sp. HB161653]
MSHYSWEQFFDSVQQQDYYPQILNFVAEQRAQGKVVFPPQSDVFNAFHSTPFEKIKVVILGQDPYHGKDQAHGLCFSVRPGIKPPPSLVNIYKALVDDIDGFETPTHGYLQSWATQGVFMLNTVLTVEQGKAHSHAKCGWERFTDQVIDCINDKQSGVVFLLWGAHAQKKGRMIDTEKHCVLSAPHPSPLSAHRGFFTSRPFSKANAYLQAQGKQIIDWRLPRLATDLEPSSDANTLL